MKRTASAIAAAGLVAGFAGTLAALRRTRRMDVNGRVALITGGSRGLGLLIARELGRRGAHVVIAARDEDELERARQDLSDRHINVRTIRTDLSTPTEAERAVNEGAAVHGQLDILVNNAGVMTVGPFEHLSTDDFQEAMAVHFWAPLYAIQAAIPYMRKAGGGRIVNISSVGGKVAVPHMAAYCASKFALTGLSTALRPELAEENILITTVSPGLMRTGSAFNPWFKGQHRREFTWFAIAGSVPGLSTDADRGARRVVEAMRHGDAELIITWPARLAIAAQAITPCLIASVMAFANRALPSPTANAGDEAHSGWQSSSRWAPSRLTRLTEKAAVRNNELP